MVAELQKGTFEHNLATLVLGVDTLWGGNVADPSGTKHFIADSWTSGLPFPEIMDDPFAAELRVNEEGVMTKKDQKKEVRVFTERYYLDSLPNTLRQQIRSITDEDRATYLKNLVYALEIMRDRALAEVGLFDMPSYESMYMAATHSAVTFPDPAPYREHLRAALASAGFETRTSRNLLETRLAWQAANKLSEDAVPETVARLNAELLAKTRIALFERILPLIPGYAPDLSDVAF